METKGYHYKTVLPLINGIMSLSRVDWSGTFLYLLLFGLFRILFKPYALCLFFQIVKIRHEKNSEKLLENEIFHLKIKSSNAKCSIVHTAHIERAALCALASFKIGT